ncbi:hypothetical protein HN51_032655 [Arachis hypogaea]|nr:uncharacterized protein DS421_10g308580 [Arachis hypogaea]
MMKIATKISFVMILLALVATNGFGLPKTPTNVVPQQDCPGGCNFLINVCFPLFPACINGKCTCAKLDNNNASTKQERHYVIHGEKGN